MKRKTMLAGFVALALTAAVPGAPAAAVNIDCTGRSGSNNCPRQLPQVRTGPHAGKYVINGTQGNDVLRGSKSDRGDQINGGAGADRLIGEAGNDFLQGGPGNDRLDGSGGNDILHGGPGNDSLGADSGRDLLRGGPGNDGYGIPNGSHSIIDESGNDFLIFYKSRVDTARYRRIGKDLVIKHDRGEVRIGNHFGTGFIERIEFRGGGAGQVTAETGQLAGSSRIGRLQAQQSGGVGGFIGREEGFVQITRGDDTVRIDDVDLTNPEAVNKATRDANAIIDKRRSRNTNNGGGGGDNGRDYPGNGEGPTGNEGCNGCP